ncbi:alpha-2-macroglobulin family protein [Winogradskyella sp. A3E31]|uniref:alpha-2-macroglobulin family protein n=1 Tax=Winogradskyella sp. A3E31 TaxID=3349637 RepID=UPI00398A9AD4
MKYYISILMLICFAQFSEAQDNYYSEQWKAVETLEKDGKTKSAAELVEHIYIRAKADNSSVQRVKSLLFQSKYLQILEEESQLTIVNNFKTEIENSDTVTKHLLENMLATMYWQYFKQNRYRFYDRSTTSAKVSDDFRTWDLETLFKEIHIYYQKSLENGLLLQQEPLSDYEALLVEVEGSKDYRPTLFDLLNHNALDFYKTDENTISQPAYQFKINDPKYLSSNETFIDLDISSKDSINLQLNALKIYQSLLRFHRKNKTARAFVTADVERMNFVYNKAVFPNKDDLLLTSLIEASDVISNEVTSGLYQFEIAKLYQKQGNTFNAANDNDEHRWKLKEALSICDTVIKTFPKSDAAKKCAILKEQILQHAVQIKAEAYIPIDKPSRVLVTYKNLETLDFNIFKVSHSQLKAYDDLYRPEEKMRFFSKLKAIHSWKADLRNEGDYQTHSTEIVLTNLENGLYLIKADTNTEEEVFSATHIQATNIALIEHNTDEEVTFQVINRNNGMPLSNLTVEAKYRRNGSGQYHTKTFNTNSKGQFVFDKTTSYYRNISFKIITSSDTGFFGDYYINRSYNKPQNNKTLYNTHLFTDRSIYRPGQTVYFKGIITKTLDNKTSVLEENKAKVSLHNVNGEKVSSLEVVTNDFGSFHGEFIIPSSGLTGNYYIRVESDVSGTGHHYFSVEEYKRPKFEATFKPITETYRVNDSVTIKGEALAFVGSTISDAKVVYRVKRIVRMPRWYYWRSPYFNSAPQEITYGETVTNAKGEFDIQFKALPDDTVNKENLPVFEYEVTADVTDINGETRSATQIVRVGYHALTATIEAPQQFNKSTKELDISIDTKNLNGEYVPASGTLKIYKLQAPETVLRPRPWNAPDYQSLTEQEFKTLFPLDAYENEHLMTNWEKGKLVFESDFNTKTSKKINVDRFKNWESGQYIIELESKDKFGQTVKDKTYLNVYSNNDETVADNQLFDIQLNKTQYKTGETAVLTFGSAAEPMFVTLDIEKGGKIIDTQIHELNNSKKQIEIPVNEKDLGGFVVHYHFAVFNDYTGSKINVNVPYPKTDLDIEVATFRDKLQPGQDETWSFKIKGPQGDKVTAELLASMYDMSLDEFKPHQWTFNPIRQQNYYSRLQSRGQQSFNTTTFRQFNDFKQVGNYPYQSFDQLNWFGLYFGKNYKNKNYYRGTVTAVAMNEMSIVEESESEVIPFSNDEKFTTSQDLDSLEYEFLSKKIKMVPNNQITSSENQKIIPRKNLQETAFFFPQLQTDKDGNVSFNFKAPEALTWWKLQLLAHTKTLESTVAQFETVTQKELMVIPNVPRFLREGDQISISTKISNITDKTLPGIARLELKDPLTGKNLTIISGELDKAYTVMSELTDREFTIEANGNTQVSWKLLIPKDISVIQFKITATTIDFDKGQQFSDGEQNVLPVLSNRMLVTETLPMWVRSNQTKTFTLDKLANLGTEGLEVPNDDSSNVSSSSLKHHKLTLEMTSNPAWYAVQALPYLMEYPYECNEQTFARYYSNALAQHIVNSNPKIEAVFKQWASQDDLISALEKNQDIKQLLIEETPWLRDAQSETEQKKRIGLLFDLNHMKNELTIALRKLKNNQLPSGAWPWFNGGRANRYITQHIISGFGHLEKLGVSLNKEEMVMVEKAISYLDTEFIKEYKDIRKYDSKADLSTDHLSYMQLHYLYTRSFYPEIKASSENISIQDYYLGQIEKYWLERSLYAKGLMTLVTHRANKQSISNKIIIALKENSITSEELGMYWKENTNSLYWHQAPIETQALIIEAFSEVGSSIQSASENLEDIDNLKIWLLKNKQTNQWKTTKATTEAVYALLLQGSDWLDVSEMVEVTVGDETITKETLKDSKIEAGTGYYKTSWTGSDITSEKAEVTISKTNDGIAWGALYWQYFEDLDKITSAETPLKLSKKLFKKTNGDTGEILTAINENSNLNVGDLIRVRIELRSDRPMEFVHLKDMRASGLEPINVLSQYKWQDGLGYYESTKDAATNFFIDYLPKGVFVFEYDLRVNNSGNMSNGISTIQSMYAPEFSSHSEGIRISVD